MSESIRTRGSPKKSEFIRNSDAQTEVDERTGTFANAKFRLHVLSFKLHTKAVKKIGFIEEVLVFIYFCSRRTLLSQKCVGRLKEK